MKKKWVVLSIMALLVLVAAVWLYRQSRYETVHPVKEELVEAVYGLGRVRSNKHFEVIVGVISTVTRLYADEGDHVKKGVPLIAFDSQALFRAPFNGTVTLVTAREGETALPHMVLMRLEDLSDRFIELSLEQQAALRVQEGQRALVSFESLRGDPLVGKVTALFSRENEFLAHIRVEGLPKSVLPGMTADVTVEVGSVSGALMVPVRAVENGVISVRDGRRWRQVKVNLGTVSGEKVEVLGSSLSPESEIRVRKD